MKKNNTPRILKKRVNEIIGLINLQVKDNEDLAFFLRAYLNTNRVRLRKDAGELLESRISYLLSTVSSSKDYVVNISTYAGKQCSV